MSMKSALDFWEKINEDDEFRRTVALSDCSLRQLIAARGFDFTIEEFAEVVASRSQWLDTAQDFSKPISAPAPRSQNPP